MLCHCVAGGVPRDLIRAVRTTLDQRRRFDASDINSIGEAVVASEVASLQRGLLARLVGSENQTERAALSAFSAIPSDEPLDLYAVSSVFQALQHDDTPYAAQELGAALYFYCTVQEVFARRRSRLLRNPSLADELTTIRALLPISATLTKARLDLFRKRPNLPTLEAVT